MYTCKVICYPVSPSRPSALKKILKGIHSSKPLECIKKPESNCGDELDELQVDVKDTGVKQNVMCSDDDDDDRTNIDDGDNKDDGDVGDEDILGKLKSSFMSELQNQAIRVFTEDVIMFTYKA